VGFLLAHGFPPPTPVRPRLAERGCQHGECIVGHEAPASPEAVLWLGVEPAESFVLVDGVVTGLVLRT
jgi:hypothetical protein